MTTHVKEILAVVSVLALSVALYFIINATPSQPVACTEEARLCPDGSAVGRVGPSCEFAPCPTEGGNAGGTGDVGVGDSKIIGGVRITLNSVPNDFRCPSDVQCIQAGAIVANVTFEGGTLLETFNMPSDEVPRPFGRYQVSIVDIQPPRISTVEPDPTAYRITFKVEARTDEQMVETYLHEHINGLSSEKAVLGGTFYVTKVTFMNPGELVVEYEDGHIALVADAVYTLLPTGDVTIKNFVVRKNSSDTVEIPRGPSLDLSGQGLTSVSQTTFSRTELVSLDLSHNTLTGALPAEVRKLSALEWLNLSRNEFTGVPAEVGQLSELRYLDLSFNKLTGLPYELGNLKKLEVLNLIGNAYAKADLAIIKQGLPKTVRILGEY